MADKFGRHKSTRWVRASVPSYGDEWNDDDYNYGSSESESDADVKSPDQMVAERFVIPDQQESPSKHQEKLVLSIDKLQDEGSDSDADEHADLHADADAPVPDQAKSHHQGAIQETVVTAPPKHNEMDIEPPTPTYVNKTALPETPASERSFQSDADSIQNETDLRVGHTKTSLVDQAIEETDEEDAAKDLHDIQPPEDFPESHYTSSEYDTPVDPKGPGFKDTEPAEVQPTPLVLSIDDRKYISDSESETDSDQDPIPYYEKRFEQDSDIDDKIDQASEKSRSTITHSPEHSYGHDDAREVPETSHVDASHDGSEALDSLINDLQNASLKEEPILPNIDTDVSMPDFNKSYSYYDLDDMDDDSQDEQYTPIAPLATKDEQRFHQEYVLALSHKTSIRKPPSTLPPEIPAASASVPASPVEPDSASRASSLKPAQYEQPLDSPRYTTFTSAVEANSDRESTAEPPDSQKLAASPDLHPVGSTGSLSTGKMSLDQRPDFEAPSSNYDKDLNRRDSTMSTNTFSMGAWKPNTTNFRDQFISDNDNESSFNFNMENDNSGYQRFTKPRNVSDNMSFISASSIPETIDVALPSIHEDPDDDLNHDETFSSGNGTSQSDDKSHDGKSLAASTTNEDSILNDHDYETGKFKEAWSSQDSVLKVSTKSQQRYTSLLSPVPDTEKESTRTVSDASSTLGGSIVPSISIGAPTLTSDKTHTRTVSDGSNTTLTTRRTFPPSAYPVSNWKQIMKPSQSQDRIALLRDALIKEVEYDTGLQTWLHETLTKSDNSSTVHIGKIASQAYQNAAHNDLRRHISIRSRVSSVKDKVESGGLQASNLGKKFFNRGKKLMRSNIS